jgi:hypothetical protein
MWAAPSDRSDDPFWVTGGCLILAQALKKELGRKAQLVDLVEPDAPGIGLTHPGTPHHVLVRFSGALWDAVGAHTDDEVLEAWDKAAPKSVRRPLGLERHNAARAREVRLATYAKASPATKQAARRLAVSLAERAR